MKKNKKSNIILITLICLMILYIINSTLITKNILIYTKLFLEKLFPASFLFFTFSSLLIDYNIIEKISNTLRINGANFYIIAMSLISGFPSGSKYTKDLLEKNLITEKNANYLIKFTHFPNPVFILGPVSLLFPNKTYALKILACIIFANFIIALINHPKEKNTLPIKRNKTTSFAKVLPEAILSSCKTLIIIYGTSIFFYLIITMINHYINLPLQEYVLINGIFDLTNGTFLTSLITNNTLRSIYIIFFFCFGGLSVHMQTKSIIADTKIQYKNFLIGRIAQTIIACLLLILIINW